MKRILLVPLALVAALLVATAAGADTKTVQITGGGFTPKATTIAIGDTVTWHNADTSAHQVVANNGSFASPVLKPDETCRTMLFVNWMCCTTDHGACPS